MIRIPLLCAIVALASFPVSAQEDTAKHRAVFEEVNAKLPKLKVSKAKLEDEELTWTLKAWSDGKEIRKIEASVPGEDGEGSDELYFAGGKLVFVFRQYTTGSGSDAKKEEHRFYFTDSKLVKWIDEAKKPVDLTDSNFATEGTILLENSAKFLKALGGKADAGGKEKPAKAGEAKTTDGTFVRIDEGDYFHFVIKDAKGEEVSFFILKGDKSVDKVTDEPEKFAGKKCRVKWKTSTENIPEAGGKMEIDQILSVEWTTGK